jgi:hypothetical protein
MARIRNNHKSPIGLPGGLTIPAGKSVDVPNWDEVKKNKVVAAWVRAGTLSTGKADAETAEADAEAPRTTRVKGRQPVEVETETTDTGEGEGEEAELSDDKEVLRAELEELGYEAPSARTSVAKLQEMVLNARAEARGEGQE